MSRAEWITCPQKASHTLHVRGSNSSGASVASITACTRSRGVRAARSRVDTTSRQPRGEAAERRFEQAVLVVEIVRDQPRRDAGALADQRQRCRSEADLGHRVDGRLDELPAADILGFERASSVCLVVTRLNAQSIAQQLQAITMIQRAA